MRITMIALGLLCLGVPAVRAGETKCAAHQHEAVEQNDDEGGTVKRCICDDGWDANGPAGPCQKAKAAKPKKK
jgi:hypothetical protein